LDTSADKKDDRNQKGLFPLKSTTGIVGNKMDIPEAKKFDKDLKDILNKKDDLEEFVVTQKMEKQL